MRKSIYPRRTSLSLSEAVYLELLELSNQAEISLGEEIRNLIKAGLKLKQNEKELMNMR
jgi:hypothetical protein